MKDELAEIVRSFSGKHILVIGDVAKDVWRYGTVHRTSPEAPVPVILEDYVESAPGMAGLVSAMIEALGGRATLVATDNRPIKTRIMARVPGRAYQPICRLDQESDAAITDRIANDLLYSSQQAILGGAAAILLCDYRKGTVTPYLCQGLRGLSCQYGIPIAVDPGRGTDWWAMYRGMVIKANEHEWRESRFTDMVQCVQNLGLPALIVTRGDDGMSLATNDGKAIAIHGTGVDGADPVGCGDQVHAVLGLCLATGVPLRDACELANVAARMQVQRQGCVPVTATELMAEIST